MSDGLETPLAGHAHDACRYVAAFSRSYTIRSTSSFLLQHRATSRTWSRAARRRFVLPTAMTEYFRLEGPTCVRARKQQSVKSIHNVLLWGFCPTRTSVYLDRDKPCRGTRFIRNPVRIEGIAEYYCPRAS